jgi:pimeloyl-ACP methyl ester carboxylesterase
MAGGALFRMARDRPRLFASVARLQSLMARLAPSVMARMLLTTAQGGDAELARDPVFRARMAAMLKAGLGHASQSYVAEISAYMQPWGADLSKITAPVTLWHGEADSWAPIALSEHLAATFSGPVTFNRLPGLSHYSTLAHAVQRIAAA